MTDTTAPRGEGMDVADDAGFTATVLVPAPPDAVFTSFTDPRRFAQWFIVDGYTTPAEEIRLDPRPGGTVTGVMVGRADGTRIPFRLRYGRIDPPRLVQFTFDEPRESVTIEAHPTSEGLTRVSYHRPLGPAADVHGAQSMLDALAESFGRMEPEQPPHAPRPGHAADGDLTGLIRRLRVPEGFTAPGILRHGPLHAHAISRSDLEDDVAGINASLELIPLTRGGTWPTAPVTADEDYVDLVWHECEFRDGKSFTYAVYDDAGQYVGCCYFSPVGSRTPLTEALLPHDVDISWWVVPDAYRAGHYRTLYHALQRWATTAFGFVNPHYSNREIPG